jgi:hypothetical protein
MTYNYATHARCAALAAIIFQARKGRSVTSSQQDGIDFGHYCGLVNARTDRTDAILAGL